MEEAARDAGLGVLTLEEKVKFWREAIEKKRSRSKRWESKYQPYPSWELRAKWFRLRRTKP